jgi:transketolase
MRSAFFKTYFDFVERGDNVHLLTADLGFGVLTPYLEKGSRHVTNVGVAEQNMVGLAAGMALRGMRVYCYSMVPFLLFRTLDQVRSDLCAMKLPVTLVGVGGGLAYGLEGMTHHAVEDIAVARALPNLTVLSPGDPHECVSLLEAARTVQGPVYLRLGANNDPVLHKPGTKIQLGKIAVLREGGSAAIITTGAMLPRCNAAVSSLDANGIKCGLYSAHTLKPLDKDGILAIAKRNRVIMTVEEHSLINGLGSAVAEILLDIGWRGKLLRMALPDEYATKLGSCDWLRNSYGLSPENIAAKLSKALE